MKQQEREAVIDSRTYLEVYNAVETAVEHLETLEFRLEQVAKIDATLRVFIREITKELSEITTTLNESL
jgi:hypothetical protein